MAAFGGFAALRATFDKTYRFTMDAGTTHHRMNGRVWYNGRNDEDPRALLAVLSGTVEEPNRDITIVVVVPPKPTARWWHEYATLASDIYFLTGEVETYPCAVLVYSSTSIARMRETRSPKVWFWDWRGSKERK